MASAVKFCRRAITRFICSTRTGRSAPCIAPTAGRRRNSPSSSKARSRRHLRRLSGRPTCSSGIRCEPMTIVYDKLMALKVEPAVQVYDAKDCMLYALGVGLGHDPMNEDELAFVYEKDLKVLPTMATVIGHSGSLVRDRNTGIDWVMVVNGEQGFTLHRPLTGRGEVVGHTRIVDVVDKGAGKGALLLTE